MRQELTKATMSVVEKSGFLQAVVITSQRSEVKDLTQIRTGHTDWLQSGRGAKKTGYTGTERISSVVMLG